RAVTASYTILERSASLSGTNIELSTLENIDRKECNLKQSKIPGHTKSRWTSSTPVSCRITGQNRVQTKMEIFMLCYSGNRQTTLRYCKFAEGEHTRSNFAIIELDTSVSIKIMMQYNLVDGLRATT
ncbi:hypothetical protein Tsp_15268, partial [Trichinella spiralis]|uniref:hypothetical protein n=1 Tax=Trichinella spiralis TaxID=6334 RepID=UPI0001EFE485